MSVTAKYIRTAAIALIGGTAPARRNQSRASCTSCATRSLSGPAEAPSRLSRDLESVNSGNPPNSQGRPSNLDWEADPLESRCEKARAAAGAVLGSPGETES